MPTRKPGTQAVQNLRAQLQLCNNQIHSKLWKVTALRPNQNSAGVYHPLPFQAFIIAAIAGALPAPLTPGNVGLAADHAA